MMGLQPGFQLREAGAGGFYQNDGFGVEFDLALPAENGFHDGQHIDAGRQLRLDDLCANLSRGFGIGEGREQGEYILGGAVLSLNHTVG